MQKIAIVIPCYNEEKRIGKSNITYLLENTPVDIFFANDGSKDGTVALLNTLVEENSGRCFLLDYKINEGKANTIYKAVNHINNKQVYNYIGYFDADFSTPAEEIERLLTEAQNSATTQFLFGSRIKVLNSGIKRKTYRHIIGRIIITLINIKFKLGIYDTQCGAKLFSSNIINHSFNQPFKTSWLFDVEIFVRLKRLDLLKTGKEIPIYNWIDVDGSKLGWKTGFKIIKELYLLVKNYGNQKNTFH